MYLYTIGKVSGIALTFEELVSIAADWTALATPEQVAAQFTELGNLKLATDGRYFKAVALDPQTAGGIQAALSKLEQL